MAGKIGLALLALLCLSAPITGTDNRQQQVLGNANKTPNIIFILTDDQDLHMDSIDWMPFLQKRLLHEGTFFKKHYCTIAVCCPSRVSLWTGKAAHNTNVTDLWLPYGGYEKFVQQGHNENYLPVWLQNAGLGTYYAGKLFNSHTVDNYNDPYPSSWTGHDFLLDPFTYSYLNSTFQRNQDPPKSYEGHYSTDVLAEKVYGFLDDAVEADKPFFLTAAPIAPHSNIDYIPDGVVKNGSPIAGPPISHPRHEHLFKSAVVPRHANFNPDKPSGANWVRTLPKQTQENVDWNDHHYRQRLRALQAVDEFIETLFHKLDDYGILDNTYIIYTADNGYHIGHHRLQPGKECGYEEDINVPLIIRGPGVPRGETSEIVTSHTDLVPTIFEALGLDLKDEFDGAPIPLSKTGLEDAKQTRHEHVNVEYWGWAASEGKFDRYFFDNNTYKSLRLIGQGYNFYYSVWCNNVHELYDLTTDPGQLNNLHPSASELTGVPSPEKILGKPLSKVLERLDSLLFVLKSCKGRVCTKPWETLHPQGDVHTLHDALAERFDEYYSTQVEKISFNRCEGGYILDAEGPQYTEGYRQGVHWSEWV